MIHSFSKLFFYHNKYHTLKNDYKICFSMKRKRWNSTSTKNSINDNLSNNEESLIKDSSKNNLTSEVKEKKKDSSDFNDKELKNAIKKQKPYFMKIWYLLAAGATLASIFYYTNESDRYERKVEKVIKMISNPDIEIRKKGLDALESCFFIQQRLPTTVVEIPQGSHFLVQNGCIAALIESLFSNDAEVQKKAIIWLITLADEDVEAREQIIYYRAVEPILDIINKTSNNSSLWIAANALLLSLMSYKETQGSIIKEPDILKSVNQMAKTKHPISVLFAARMLQTMIKYDPTIQSSSYLNPQEIKDLTSNLSTPALNAAIQSVIPQKLSGLLSESRFSDIFYLQKTINHIGWAFFFSLIGSFYGKLRWTLRAKMAGIKESSKFASKHSKIGRWIFLLLTMDLIAQNLMLWPKKEIPFIKEKEKFIPDFILGYPITTFIPMVDVTLLTLLGLHAIRRQHYIILPTMMAFLYAYYEPIEEILNPYLDIIADKQEDLKKFFQKK